MVSSNLGMLHCLWDFAWRREITHFGGFLKLAINSPFQVTSSNVWLFYDQININHSITLNIYGYTIIIKEI